jgi:hypothetical protein
MSWFRFVGAGIGDVGRFVGDHRRRRQSSNNHAIIDVAAAVGPKCTGSVRAQKDVAERVAVSRGPYTAPNQLLG